MNGPENTQPISDLPEIMPLIPHDGKYESYSAKSKDAWEEGRYAQYWGTRALYSQALAALASAKGENDRLKAEVKALKELLPSLEILDGLEPDCSMACMYGPKPIPPKGCESCQPKTWLERVRAHLKAEGEKHG